MSTTRLVVDPPSVPALVVGQVTHARTKPVRHRFTNRHHAWLIEVTPGEDPPVVPTGEGSGVARLLGQMARFDARDHLDGGRLGGGIRGDLERFLARRGIELERDDRVLLLAQPRYAGYVFNPLSVFWVLAGEGRVRAIVAEVHNTYGERHAYLLDPDADGRSRTDKAFYVSPFNRVDGGYRIRTTLTGTRLAVSIALVTEDGPLFGAAVTGVPRPVTALTMARVLMTQPGGSYRTQALIRAHGIWLWLRRLPVQARPQHDLEAVR